MIIMKRSIHIAGCNGLYFAFGLYLYVRASVDITVETKMHNYLQDVHH